MNRKMRVNAAKAAKRKASRRNPCDLCGGNKVGEIQHIDPATGNVLDWANICEPPAREDMH